MWIAPSRYHIPTPTQHTETLTPLLDAARRKPSPSATWRWAGAQAISFPPRSFLCNIDLSVLALTNLIVAPFALCASLLCCGVSCWCRAVLVFVRVCTVSCLLRINGAESGSICGSLLGGLLARPAKKWPLFEGTVFDTFPYLLTSLCKLRVCSGPRWAYDES
jgi:hypothetical protein